MIRLFIHRPILACSVALLMLLVGSVSIITLPVSQYPDIVPGTVQVTASYPGADAETTARVITQPLEQQINGVEGMIYMSSNSTSNGSSSITVTFDIGYDLNIAAVDVQNRVQTAEAQLPSETQQAGVSVVKQSADIAIIISLKSTEGAYDNYLSWQLCTDQCCRSTDPCSGCGVHHDLWTEELFDPNLA